MGTFDATPVEPKGVLVNTILLHKAFVPIAELIPQNSVSITVEIALILQQDKLKSEDSKDATQDCASCAEKARLNNLIRFALLVAKRIATEKIDWDQVYARRFLLEIIDSVAFVIKRVVIRICIFITLMGMAEAILPMIVLIILSPFVDRAIFICIVYH